MKPIARMFEDAFGPPDLPALPEAPLLARHRRKLWELPCAWHCPLVGTCLTVSDLRQLAKRAGLDEPGMHDYTLHSLAVDHCGGRSEIAELLQRFLDQRYALSIRQFAKAKGGEAVLALWRQGLAERNVAGSLWAAWTHADIHDYEGAVIYGELHMLSHQLGAQERAEQKRLPVLEQENARLREEVAALRQKQTAAQCERERSVVMLEERLAESERQAAQFKRDESGLAAASKTEALNNALRERNETLSQRLTVLERRNAGYAGRITELVSELAHLRNAQRRPGAEIEAAVVSDAAGADTTGNLAERSPNIHLAGRRVVCIGGRTNLIDQYRRLVEASGGRFIHHDGGQEENEHRIDAIVASADAVLCQIGHISHPAYWRIKDACKQRGLPCIFLKSCGVTTFARNLEMLAGAHVGTGMPAQH